MHLPTALFWLSTLTSSINMFAVEPPPSQADLHFRVFGFPVRVHPWFWIVTLLLAISGSDKLDPIVALAVGRGGVCFDLDSRAGPRVGPAPLWRSS